MKKTRKGTTNIKNYRKLTNFLGKLNSKLLRSQSKHKNQRKY